MKNFHSLLVWLSCSVVSASRLNGGAGSSRFSETISTSEFPLIGKFSQLTISPPIVPSQDTLKVNEFIRASKLTKKYILRELNRELECLIRSRKATVAEASLVLLSSPFFRDLTEEAIDEAVWTGHHYILRCLQNKMLRTLLSMPHANGNICEKFDKQTLHKLFAYSYKRLWYEPLFWEVWFDEMDWVSFWYVIFEVDNDKLFKDLFTQKLSLPFNRHENLVRSNLHRLVRVHKANKIGAYLEISGCKEAITFNEDGRLDVHLLKWDESGKPLFEVSTVIFEAVKRSSHPNFFEIFESAYPGNFPFGAIANEALRQARFNIFGWVNYKNPEGKLGAFNLDLGIMGSDHLETRRKFFYWAVKKFPEWVPSKDTIKKLCPELLTDAIELYPNIRPVQEDFLHQPSYGLLKWAMVNEPEFIPINFDSASIAANEGDLDLFRFIYQRYHKTNKRHLGMDALAFKMGDINSVTLCIVHYGAPKQDHILQAAKNGHVSVLKHLAAMEYKIDFSKRNDVLAKIANFGHIHVMEYIYKNYPEIFKDSFNLDNVLCHHEKDDDRKLKMLIYLYRLFGHENIHFSFKSLAVLMSHQNTAAFDFILKRHPTIFKDEIEKGAHEEIKKMILYAVKGKNQEKVEFLMEQIQGELVNWYPSDLCSIAKNGAPYLLNMIYRDYKEKLSLWDPLKYVKELLYLQWYHYKVGDLPWDDLAHKAAIEDHIATLNWILTKHPDSQRAIKRRHHTSGRRHRCAICAKGNVHNLLNDESASVYYTPEKENISSVRDEVLFYYKKCDLYPHQQPMETTTTL